MPEDHKSKDPNDELAKRIATELENSGLIIPERTQEIVTKLKTGKATVSDWIFWAEEMIRPSDTEVELNDAD